jgi:hypothetical protein
MDPATIVGTVVNGVQIAELALNVFINLGKYYRNVLNAPTKAKELREELNFLVDLLVNVQEIFESTPAGGTKPTVPEELGTLFYLLEDLYQRTKPKVVRGFRRLRWPFDEAENTKILEKIQRFNQNLNMKLNIRNRYNRIHSCF